MIPDLDEAVLSRPRLSILAALVSAAMRSISRFCITPDGRGAMRKLFQQLEEMLSG